MSDEPNIVFKYTNLADRASKLGLTLSPYGGQDSFVLKNNTEPINSVYYKSLHNVELYLNGYADATRRLKNNEQ